MRMTGQEQIVSHALRGAYERADEIAAELVEHQGYAAVCARGAQPALMPCIEHRLEVVRGEDRCYRVMVDAHTGSLPQPNRPPVMRPSSGFMTAARAVREARRILTAAAGSGD